MLKLRGLWAATQMEKKSDGWFFGLGDGGEIGSGVLVVDQWLVMEGKGWVLVFGTRVR